MSVQTSDSSLREAPPGTRNRGFIRPPGSVPERAAFESAQRALLNILEDFAAEKSGLERGQRALFNIFEDFNAEKARMEGAQRAVSNILDDFVVEKRELQAAQRSVLNILDDFSEEKAGLEGAQRAALNILDDFSQEKGHLQEIQRAVLNILDDFDAEKAKVEQANQRLTEEVQERKRVEQEVQQVNKELLAANEELEAFTYSVAHDLRAPLRHIAGFAKILLDEYGAPMQPEALSHLQRVIEGARQMGSLVDDLLKLSRVSRQELTRRSTDLNGLVEEVLAGLGGEIAGRRIEWRIGKLPAVECDPALVKQVFYNLLSNGIKYTRPQQHAVIEVDQMAVNGEPAVFVRDNGVGFNMKYAGKLFGVFQRLHRSQDFEGTGVGLATVQRIVHKHGGRVWAEAELGKGATFYFTLGSHEKTELQERRVL